jgi:hypothetical protein
LQQAARGERDVKVTAWYQIFDPKGNAFSQALPSGQVTLRRNGTVAHFFNRIAGLRFINPPQTGTWTVRLFVDQTQISQYAFTVT